MFDFKVFVGNAFPQKVQSEFLQGFVIELVLGEHLSFITRTFCFNNHSNIGFGVLASMNY